MTCSCACVIVMSYAPHGAAHPASRHALLRRRVGRLPPPVALRVHRGPRERRQAGPRSTAAVRFSLFVAQATRWHVRAQGRRTCRSTRREAAHGAHVPRRGDMRSNVSLVVVGGTPAARALALFDQSLVAADAGQRPARARGAHASRAASSDDATRTGSPPSPLAATVLEGRAAWRSCSADSSADGGQRGCRRRGPGETSSTRANSSRAGRRRRAAPDGGRASHPPGRARGARPSAGVAAARPGAPAARTRRAARRGPARQREASRWTKQRRPNLMEGGAVRRPGRCRRRPQAWRVAEEAAAYPRGVRPVRAAAGERVRPPWSTASMSVVVVAAAMRTSISLATAFPKSSSSPASSSSSSARACASTRASCRLTPPRRRMERRQAVVVAAWHGAAVGAYERALRQRVRADDEVARRVPRGRTLADGSPATPRSRRSAHSWSARFAIAARRARLDRAPAASIERAACAGAGRASSRHSTWRALRPSASTTLAAAPPAALRSGSTQRRRAARPHGRRAPRAFAGGVQRAGIALELNRSSASTRLGPRSPTRTAAVEHRTRAQHALVARRSTPRPGRRPRREARAGTRRRSGARAGVAAAAAAVALPASRSPPLAGSSALRGAEQAPACAGVTPAHSTRGPRRAAPRRRWRTRARRVHRDRHSSERAPPGATVPCLGSACIHLGLRTGANSACGARPSSPHAAAPGAERARRRLHARSRRAGSAPAAATAERPRPASSSS